MPHEDYVPAPQSPDHSFDPASLYQNSPAFGRAPVEPPPPPRPLPRRVLPLCGALALLGVVSLLIGERQFRRAHATRGWIETRAEIMSAKIRATNDGDYHLDLAYRYRAGPRMHESTRLALEPSREREAVYAAAARYRPGARVEAWFDPAAPHSAVLERPRVPMPRAASVLGGLLLLGGVAPLAFQLGRRLAHRLALRRLAKG